MRGVPSLALNLCRFFSVKLPIFLSPFFPPEYEEGPPVFGVAKQNQNKRKLKIEDGRP